MADPKVPLALALDRAAPTALTEQIAADLRSAIEQGRLAPGARLPSWRDLASQLGVARGTVRAAYETLIDAGLVQALGAAGTHVARRVPVRPQDDLPATAAPSPLPGLVRGNGVFQMGVPAQDGIPAKLWSRLFVRAARTAAGAAPDYPDPRGEPALRTQIAAMLAVARGLACSPARST